MFLFEEFLVLLVADISSDLLTMVSFMLSMYKQVVFCENIMKLGMCLVVFDTNKSVCPGNFVM